jgi:alanyl-tRNA synthetase
VHEEEAGFLRTLSLGIKRFEAVEAAGHVTGKDAFELYDTFGFPFDLTQLMASEKGFQVSEADFKKELQVQKDRSKKAASSETGDWITVGDESPTQFIGYDYHESDAHLIKYRKVKAKDAEVYQLVLDKTPFYAESGGQVGDTGLLLFGDEKIEVIDTKKENDLIIHYTKKLPSKLEVEVAAKINVPKRNDTIKNHSATHLLQAALRHVLGHHVQQKGSLVNPEYLRFDFSHFSKMTTEEIAQVEKIVNDKIMENVHLEEQRNVPYQKAIEGGVMALFGEKYGEFVRVITFDRNFSNELCGGCHVPATGAIGLFKIISESSTAAGVRRIEAVTGRKALEYVNKNIADLTAVAEILNNPKNIILATDNLVKENDSLKKEIEGFTAKQTTTVKNELLGKKQVVNGITFIGETVDLTSNDAIKNLVYMLKNEATDYVFAIGANLNGKASLHIMIDEKLVKDKNWNAGAWIKETSPLIKGGGGGQPFYASAGGTNAEGLQAAIDAVKAKLSI